MGLSSASLSFFPAVSVSVIPIRHASVESFPNTKKTNNNINSLSKIDNNNSNLAPASDQKEEMYVSNTLKKNKFIDIYLSPSDFYNRDIFLLKLDKLNKSYRYSILFRVCFGDQPSFKMLGNQIGLDYVNSSNITELYNNLHDNLLLRLESSMINYNFSGDQIIIIQLLAYKVEYTDVVHKSLDLSIKALGYHKDLIDSNKNKVDSVFNKVLPPTMDLSNYGNRLDTVVENGNIKSVLFKKDKLDLPSLVSRNKNKNFTFKPDTKMFVDNNNKYLLAVNPSVTALNAEHNIDVFTLDGNHVLHLSDRAISNTMFTRTTGNITKTVGLKSKTVSTQIKVDLDVIKLPKLIPRLKLLNFPDPNFGTLDLETYMDNGIAKVYAIGFFTNKHKVHLYYINDNLDSSEVVLRCLDDMLKSKYSGYTFYVHNLGHYVVFRIKILI